MENIDKIFWNKITGAVDFIDDIAEKLEDNKNIILVSSDNIPWYASFRNNLIDIMNEKFGKHERIRIEESREQCLFRDEKSFRRNLLEDKRIFGERTRCRERDNFVKIFADNAFIHNENNKKFYIWLDIYFESSFDKWVNFISDYMKEKDKNNKNIVFIVSYHNNFKVTPNIQFNFTCFSLKNYITEYACYVFFTILISNSKDIKTNDYFKLYLAELLTHLIKDNINDKQIEYCLECLKDYNNFLKNPKEKIKRVFVNPSISEDSIRDVIYYSQIKVFYPMLDKYRLWFTRRYATILNDILKNDRARLESFMDKNEKAIKKVEDFQFGRLKNVVDIYESKFTKDIKDDFKNVCLAVRNKLSHTEEVDFALLKSFIDIFIKNKL